LFDHPGTHDSALLLLSDVEYNMIHVPKKSATGFLAGKLPEGAPSSAASKYDVKLATLLPWWQVYDWANYDDEDKKDDEEEGGWDEVRAACSCAMASARKARLRWPVSASDCTSTERIGISP
jgi:hypothetical protein